MIGDRVRRARTQKGLPRRVLSELSGVSPRYLAQLETGEGNVSIAVLKRVADALGLSVHGLTRPDDAPARDGAHVLDLFNRADATSRALALDILSGGTEGASRAHRVCLIGLRGAGKSTLGAQAAARLDLPFVELNNEIERLGGMPVPEIMALYGLEGYRKLEAEALDRVVIQHDRMILAVAGGIVSDPATYSKLLRSFHTVWLQAAPEDHMQRVRAQGDNRPMAGYPKAMAQLKSILQDREALYGKAQMRMSTSGRSLESAVTALVAAIKALED